MDQQTYLSAFGEVLLFILAGIIFILVTLFVSKTIRPHRPNPEKLSTYESGEEPVSSAWAQFNIRFYIIALIFLLFEVEIVFLFPWSTIFANEVLIEETQGVWGWFSLIEMVTFILILALGLAYAWVNGGSPTFGFLNFATEGKIFHDFFAGLAGPAADWLFMAGLLGIGVALILGIGMRIAAVSGAIMLVLMWAAELRLENNPFMDDHLIYAGVLVVLALTAAGDTLGLGKVWAKLPIVQRLPWLR